MNLNIVDIIENNPITKLSKEYNNRLLIKIKENFTGFEQKLFVSSFYCYLNYDKNTDYVVDLDDIWRWLGFNQKVKAIALLERNFTVGSDYKHILPKDMSQDSSLNNTIVFTDSSNNNVMPKSSEKWGGHNKQTYLLTIKCFKSLCMKAQTKKAAEIHEYYINLEETLLQVSNEQLDELRLDMEQAKCVIAEKDNALVEKDTTIAAIRETAEYEKNKLKLENQRALEQSIIVQFPVNTECFYFGTIDNTTEANEKLVKFGVSNDLNTRVREHRKTYDNFILSAAFRVNNKTEIENAFKAHPKIMRNMRRIIVNDATKTEIVAYDATNFTLERLNRLIKDVIHAKMYNIENYNRLFKENEALQNENRDLKEQIDQLQETTTSQAIKIQTLTETLEQKNEALAKHANEDRSVYQNVLIPENETTRKFEEFIEKMCIVRHDVEETCTNMEGQFRIWCRTKPKKETFHALKHYLDTRFRPARISNQNKDQIAHGYVGIKLKELTYTKKHVNNDTETFLFQVCAFSPNGKILNSTLLTEYQKWKTSVQKPCSDNDMNDLKEYLNNCEYALKAVVWTDGGSNEGYYGVMLRRDEDKYKKPASHSKRVEKRTVNGNHLIATWDTIAKAAAAEKFSTAKMSKGIKDGTVYNKEFVYVVTKA
jgi:phage anti-repressor protein